MRIYFFWCQNGSYNLRCVSYYDSHDTCEFKRLKALTCPDSY